MAEWVETKLKYDEGIFVGKEYVKDGTYQSGKYKDEKFRRFKLKLKIKGSDTYPKTYNVNDPIHSDKSLKLEQLQEAQRYVIGFTESPWTNPKGEEIIMKWVQFVGTPELNSSPLREEGVTTRNPTENNKGSGEVLSHTSFSLPLPTQPQMEEFNVKYKELIEKRNVQPDFNQYLAVMIRQKYSEQLKDLLEITEKMYAKEFNK